MFWGQRSHLVGSAPDELRVGSGRVRRSVRWWSWAARDSSWLLRVRRVILPGAMACSGLIPESRSGLRKRSSGHWAMARRGSLSLNTSCGSPLWIPLLQSTRSSVRSRQEDFGHATHWSVRSRPRKHGGTLVAPFSGASGRAPGNTRGLWSRHPVGRPVAPPKHGGTLVAPHMGRTVAQIGALDRAH